MSTEIGSTQRILLIGSLECRNLRTKYLKIMKREGLF